MEQSIFGLLLWDISSHLARVFGLRRKAVRFVTNMRYREDVTNVFKQLMLQMLPGICIKQKPILMKEIIKKYIIKHIW